MGQGEETKTRDQPAVEIQERGEIFFFYRPKVGKEEAHGPDDVQRLYLVLRPESGERPVEEKQDHHSGKERKLAAKTKKDEDEKDERDDEEGGGGGGGHGSEKVNIEKQPLLRLIVMGRKSLPDPTKKSTPYWGFVEMVTTDIELVKAALRGEEYDTATRGHRHLPDARAVAEGVYRILRHNPGSRMHTHLVYKLEYPPEDRKGGDQEEEKPPQEALNIAREASFLLQIKNPEQPSGGGSGRFRGLQSKRKASFPAHMQGLLGRKRFHPADPPDFLNYEGCELLLIAASDDIEEELGLELKTEQSPESSDSSGGDLAECSDLIRTFGETGSSRPLLQSTWA